MTREALRAAMAARGVGVSALARVVGVSVAAASQALTGEGQAAPRYVAGWALLSGRRLADLDVGDLVGRDVGGLLGDAVTRLAAAEGYVVTVGRLAADAETWGLVGPGQGPVFAEWVAEGLEWEEARGAAALAGSLGVVAVLRRAVRRWECGR